MKTIPSMLPIIALTTLASCVNQPVPTSMPVSFQGGSALSEQIFRDVNTYRRDHGSRELQRHAGMDRLARDLSEYLRKNRGTFDLYGKNVSHIGSDGRSLVIMKTFNMISSGENVASAMSGASDSQTASVLVISWEKSHDHEEAMRNNAWTHTGIGTVVDVDGRVFATQLFATANTSQLAMRERYNGF